MRIRWERDSSRLHLIRIASLPIDMARVSLEDEALRALRALPDQTLGELADAVGLPRTNFGRSLTRRVQGAVEQLVNERLVEEHDGRYRLSERGRRTFADRAFDSRLSP